METKKGKIPVNAKVDIDYSSKKPKISFGYTSNKPMKDAYKQNIVGPHTMILMALWFVFFMLMSYPANIDLPEDCNLIGQNQSQYWKYELYLECDTGNFTAFFRDYKEWGSPYYGSLVEETYTPSKELIRLVILIFGSLAAMIILNIIITKILIKNKWYCNWLPKHMAGSNKKKKKFKRFNKKDVLENVIIIPKFSNVELDYKTKGDFSNCLEKIKIRNYQEQSIKNGKLGKKKKDVYKWYAIFYFERQPENGSMEVIYQ